MEKMKLGSRFSHETALNSLNAAHLLYKTVSATYPVEKRMESLAKRANILLEEAKKRRQMKGHGANAGRSDRSKLCIDWLDNCVTFGRPPPQELIDLIGFELNVSNAPRSEIKNREMFLAAAKYCAMHPEAKEKEISKAIKYRHTNLIRNWLGRPDFQDEIDEFRKYPDDPIKN